MPAVGSNVPEQPAANLEQILYRLVGRVNGARSRVSVDRVWAGQPTCLLKHHVRPNSPVGWLPPRSSQQDQLLVVPNTDRSGLLLAFSDRCLRIYVEFRTPPDLCVVVTGDSHTHCMRTTTMLVLAGATADRAIALIACGLVLLVYVGVILPAIWSTSPTRRKAAAELIRLLREPRGMGVAVTPP